MGVVCLLDMAPEQLDKVIESTAKKHGEDPAFLRRVLFAMRNLDREGRITLEAIQSIRAPRGD